MTADSLKAAVAKQPPLSSGDAEPRCSQAGRSVNELVHASLSKVAEHKKGQVTHVREDRDAIAKEEAAEPQAWIGIACLSVFFSIAALIPYNMLLAADPGSPPFLSFCTYLGYISVNCRSLPRALTTPSWPMRYHAAFAGLALLFGITHANAWMLLPASLCVLLMNVQMLLGMLLERIFWKTHYSAQQIAGALAVAVGVAMAGLATSGEATSSRDGGFHFAGGVSQMMVALTCLAVGGMLLKTAFDRFGEAVEEQILMQHLLGLPGFFVMGSSWQVIAPRLSSWTVGENTHLLGLLLLNLSFTVAHQWANVQFTARTPSLTLFNFIDALKKFLGLFVTAMLNAPPFPAASFWLGTVVLVAGSLLFASAPASKGTKAD
eukprot:TRINITY_DN6956_c0_g1_i1.p1 TRINITY_DN6956_c0_g1~~TRINITY_DN6956_c0_g1_i1.p1  ORF type:complete len:377 (-),score=44.72 TRINITY_DN6956_c0_g1_i1:49-1179(-)